MAAGPLGAVRGERLGGPEAALPPFMRPLLSWGDASTQGPPPEFLRHQTGRRREAFCQKPVQPFPLALDMGLSAP